MKLNQMLIFSNMFYTVCRWAEFLAFVPEVKNGKKCFCSENLKVDKNLLFDCSSILHSQTWKKNFKFCNAQLFWVENTKTEISSKHRKFQNCELEYESQSVDTYVLKKLFHHSRFTNLKIFCRFCTVHLFCVSNSNLNLPLFSCRNPLWRSGFWICKSTVTHTPWPFLWSIVSIYPHNHSKSRYGYGYGWSPFDPAASIQLPRKSKKNWFSISIIDFRWLLINLKIKVAKNCRETFSFFKFLHCHHFGQNDDKIRPEIL